MREDDAMCESAQARLDALAKPVGSLGQLEALGVRLCVAQGQMPPDVAAARVVVFAGDHGVAREESVAPFPSSMTLAMVHTMLAGQACVTSMARSAGADLEVVNVGVGAPCPPPAKLAPGVQYVDCAVALGTANLAKGPAMTRGEAESAIAVGRAAADRAVDEGGARVLAVGEIGIGNTTPSSALVARLLDADPVAVVGPGTGLDQAGVERKVAVVARALARDGSSPEDALGCLADLGGLEIAAMVGCYLQCRQRRIAAIVDGFISTAAALVAVRMDPAVREQLVFSTESAEPGHRTAVRGIAPDAEPLLSWGMRLGEGSAAALCLPLVQASGRLFDEVATLQEVVSQAQGQESGP